MHRTVAAMPVWEQAGAMGVTGRSDRTSRSARIGFGGSGAMVAADDPHEDRRHGTQVETGPYGVPVVPEDLIPAQRVPEAPVSVCTCGHPEEMHEHYRDGSDCGACGRDVCSAFTLDT